MGFRKNRVNELMKLSQVKSGTTMVIFVKPNSARFRIIVEDGTLIVHCTEEPVKGKVNKELVKGLSALFGTKVKLVSGFTSKQKKLLVTGLAKSDVSRILSPK